MRRQRAKQDETGSAPSRDLVQFAKQELAKPVHQIIAENQGKAALVLVRMMEDERTSDSTRAKIALELLALGGHSAEMVRFQAALMARGIDHGKLTLEELEREAMAAREELERRKIDSAKPAELPQAAPQSSANPALLSAQGVLIDVEYTGEILL